MNKSQRKIENALVKALNEICEHLKQEQPGFVWLTHFVDHKLLSQSLKIIFVFDTNENLATAKNNTLFESVFTLCELHLKRESIHIKRIDKAVYFDTEENGANFENIQWCRKYA